MAVINKEFAKKLRDRAYEIEEPMDEDLELDVLDYSGTYDTVFEDDNYKICKPNCELGLIALSEGTAWLGSYSWSTKAKDRTLDDVDEDSWVLRNWDRQYVIINKHDPKDKYLFTRGEGQMWNFRRVAKPCATWVANNGSREMWKWFLDQKFQFISTNLDKKVGNKLFADKTVFNYPEDMDMTSENKKGSNITKVVIAPGTKKIKSRAFACLSKVTEITIPDSVTSIGSYCFVSCVALTKVNIPSSIKKFPKGLFYNCRALEKIDIPSTVKSIDDYCFAYCDSLKEVTLPEGITRIPSSCFYTCKSLTKVNIPNTVTEIGSYAFNYTNLSGDLIIPDSVTEISWAAFANTNLHSVYIPASVLEIRSSAFGNKNSSLIINCEAQSQPREWDTSWHRTSDTYDRETRRWVSAEPNIVNWGVPKSQAHQVEEDLDLDIAKVPGLLSDEECEKLLDLLLSLDDMAKENKEEFLKICNTWLMNIWMADNTPSKFKLNSYIETLSNPEISHVLTFWADVQTNGGANYLIARFSEEGMENIFSKENDYIAERGDIDGATTICVSKDFVTQFLHHNESDLPTSKQNNVDEDLEIDAIEIPDCKVFEDDHWIIYQPKTIDQFSMASEGTNWFEERNRGDRDDWVYSYYETAPYYVFENKDTNEKYLYNTRENYNSIVNSSNHWWQDNNYRSHKGTAAANLQAFLETMPDTAGIMRWAIRKWPQGLADLKATVGAKEEFDKIGGVLVYDSDLYRQIKQLPGWYYRASPAEKKLAKLRDMITTIQFPRNTHIIEDYAFSKFKGLKEVIIPNTITKIGDHAFYDCESLTKVTLSNKVKSIGQGAFCGCKNLSDDIVIPATCVEMGGYVFKYCQNINLKCVASEKPSGWDKDWNLKGESWVPPTANERSHYSYSYFDVEWGYGSSDKKDSDKE